ncbi:MAG: hypothetical protein M5U14_10550 [Acidimicrobiia bacterium]|nr:hypothetical protein [Acidimicrobiia bacterium]
MAIASVISGIDGPVDRASVLAQLNQTTDLGTFGGKLPEGIDLTTSRSETLPRVFHPSYWGPIDVTADGLTDSDGAEFKNAFDLLLESMGLA